MPGNSILGGGGGIAIVSGASRLYRWKWYLPTVVLTTSPVPLLVYFGFIQLEKYF
jgi:hypothetical protein